MSTTSSRSHADRYVAIHDSTRFQALRQEYQQFVLPASVVFVGSWFLIILLGAYAPGFFGLRVFANVNLGTLAVMATFALVLVIVAMYLKFARAQLDPHAEQIRAEIEGGMR